VRWRPSIAVRLGLAAGALVAAAIGVALLLFYNVTVRAGREDVGERVHQELG
jgi:hypothetical protein